MISTVLVFKIVYDSNLFVVKSVEREQFFLPFQHGRPRFTCRTDAVNHAMPHRALTDARVRTHRVHVITRASGRVTFAASFAVWKLEGTIFAMGLYCKKH